MIFMRETALYAAEKRSDPILERKKFLAAAGAFAPIEWEAIPDLGLYMDQVVTYVATALAPLYGEEPKDLLTSSMVNNYVKQSLLPRPQGKKYYREHLAMLLMITSLKRTMAMDEIKRLFDVMVPDRRACYETFAACQKSLTAALAGAREDCRAEAVLQKAIYVALLRLECLSMLETLYDRNCAAEEEKPAEKKRRREKDEE